MHARTCFNLEKNILKGMYILRLYPTPGARRFVNGAVLKLAGFETYQSVHLASRSGLQILQAPLKWVWEWRLSPKRRFLEVTLLSTGLWTTFSSDSRRRPMQDCFPGLQTDVTFSAARCWHSSRESTWLITVRSFLERGLTPQETHPRCRLTSNSQ